MAVTARIKALTVNAVVFSRPLLLVWVVRARVPIERTALNVSTMEVDQREKAYKVRGVIFVVLLTVKHSNHAQVVAYSAVTFSLLAILSVCVTMPLALNFVSHVQHQADKEISNCKVALIVRVRLA